MLPSELLLHRYNSEEIQPRRLPVDKANLALAEEVIAIFGGCVGARRADLEEQVQILEGEETDYRVKRGLAHLLTAGFCTFETVSPLETEMLRERVFTVSAQRAPNREGRTAGRSARGRRRPHTRARAGGHA